MASKEKQSTMIQSDTPLTPIEQKFLTNFIRCGVLSTALRDTGYKLNSNHGYGSAAAKIFRQPNVQAEYERIMSELKEESVATAQEVLGYFTQVMRGELKDQFGLEASLAERTKAAQELAKRTVDIDNKKGNNEPISITLNWAKPEGSE